MRCLLLPEINIHCTEVRAATSILAIENENKAQSDTAEAAIAKKSLWQFSS